jgi:hypothetical protein
LPGTILFANRVLLVEGDSDPVFLNSNLLKLIESGMIDADLNDLSIISTGESKNTDALIRILSEIPSKPRIALLFDGDEGGKRRAKALEHLIKVHKLESKVLEAGKCIEDCVIGSDTVFVTAVANYLSKIGSNKIKDIKQKVEDSYREYKSLDVVDQERGTDGKKDVAPRGKSVAAWSREVGVQLEVIESEASPLGIAREYSILLSELAPEQVRSSASEAAGLANWIIKMLDVPKQILDPQSIIASQER